MVLVELVLFVLLITSFHLQFEVVRCSLLAAALPINSLAIYIFARIYMRIKQYKVFKNYSSSVSPMLL